MANNDGTSDNTTQAEDGKARFRLPRLFAGGEDALETREATREATGSVARPSLSQHAAVLQTPEKELAQELAHEAQRAPAKSQPVAKPQASSGKDLGDAGAVMRELESLRGEVEEIGRVLQEFSDRGLAQDKVFSTLHSELQDYKNDFIYEHFKPVVRPLLFLFDSIEQFDNEMALQEVAPDQEKRGGLTPAAVRENVVFFREQLVESLRICEVTPMEKPEGRNDPRLHKMVGTEDVEPDQDGIIQRVVRSGWYLNGRVFRQAEVVIGKKRESYDAQVWDKGKS